LFCWKNTYMKTGEVVNTKPQLFSFIHNSSTNYKTKYTALKLTWRAIRVCSDPQRSPRFSVLYCNYWGSREIPNQKCNQEQSSRECFQPPLDRIHIQWQTYIFACPPTCSLPHYAAFIPTLNECHQSLLTQFRIKVLQVKHILPSLDISKSVGDDNVSPRSWSHVLLHFVDH